MQTAAAWEGKGGERRRCVVDCVREATTRGRTNGRMEASGGGGGSAICCVLAKCSHEARFGARVTAEIEADGVKTARTRCQGSRRERGNRRTHSMVDREERNSRERERERDEGRKRRFTGRFDRLTGGCKNLESVERKHVFVCVLSTRGLD
uniref:Uncharacterized protein n=1 Tax=Hyaloperonospora arabidopsidis (strain Emoy2) TaxID=559515 RepID=M4B7C1_HYAAE